MFGNRIGWILAGFILLLEGGGVVAMYVASRPMPASDVGKKAATYTMIFPGSYASVVDTPDTSIKPGELYRQALDVFKQNSKPYRDLVELPPKPNAPLPQPAAYPAIELLKKATHGSGSDIFMSTNPKLILDFRPESEGIENEPIANLLKLGKVTERIALLHKSRNSKKIAKELFEAEYSLGVKMFEERLTWKEAEAGLDLLASASTALLNMANEDGDKARATVLQQFSDDRKTYRASMIDPPKSVIIMMHPNPTDLTMFVTKGTDRLWRIEAAMALGYMKYYSQRPADRRFAERFLEQAPKTGDTVVDLAVSIARDLDEVRARLRGN